jgi:hypothetical protein
MKNSLKVNNLLGRIELKLRVIQGSVKSESDYKIINFTFYI